ncbi:unnamed protein product [Rangifer tarandus platyrhynchus]|uniref:Uncharacterized protein n=1 Tax=Rangifer tarandus platyrhynchus TaxID=3082113 RepID=A0AC59YMH8_RANTA
MALIHNGAVETVVRVPGLTRLAYDRKAENRAEDVGFFFSTGQAYSECYLLAAMAYDCYVAMSNMLLYSQAMSPRLWVSLSAASYSSGFVKAITSETFTLSFCGNNVIDDFFCDLSPLVKSACDVNESYQVVLYFILAFNIINPTMLILASYLFIIAAILKIHSTQGCSKAFSSCGFHLTAVTLYYGSILLIYTGPSMSYALREIKWCPCSTQW